MGVIVQLPEMPLLLDRDLLDGVYCPIGRGALCDPPSTVGGISEGVMLFLLGGRTPMAFASGLGLCGPFSSCLACSLQHTMVRYSCMSGE